MIENEKNTRDKFNYLKKYYDETWDQENHTLHVGIFQNERDSLEDSYKNATDHLVNKTFEIRPIIKQSMILDIGCGTGRTLIDICLRYDCSGVGIDLSDEQINDAKEYLDKLNLDRVSSGLPVVNVNFITASGSELDKVFEKDSQFTHIISQDAILLVTNKQSLFQNIYRLLVPGGVFAVADFVSEDYPEERSKNEENLIYDLVNWNKELSFEKYEKILKTVGLSIIESERRDEDMIMTYTKLAQKIVYHGIDKDKTYAELKERYENIVSAVKAKKMGWAFFFAQKSQKKKALIAGIREKSIGRFLANYLHRQGYEIWLYGRNAKKVDRKYWHERECDISDEKSIQDLLAEIKNIDLVMMLADSGNIHFSLEELSGVNVKQCVDAKLVGSILLNKHLILKFPKQKSPFKLIWCAGKIGKKPKNLILYSMVNSGLASYIDELNKHYPQVLEAYYLPTGLISPSTRGDEFIEISNPDIVKMAQSPQIVVEAVQKIINGGCDPGMLDIPQSIL
ncbi:MAG: hypothetical protein COY69_02545 [Candidatus Magasanikbacteria bacterium CG_4_10_14_0_8_um_filter_32_14]|uniref:Methyltransferase domain-containing protein n=1 Tax=Candidatus Magasanikbacteria bacterium CG_4_10_14_0_8_um_filter_32_14 TaxID=1974640 RepID=A0A2M7R941_9BACT|nr:MAG: hypothetical protein COY69_02545 [Candidatus Magasanikbacteria bacterium CG_4_10_14_0_8_um_filter_32_14]